MNMLGERQRPVVTLEQFGFWQEYRDHDMFRVSIHGLTDGGGVVRDFRAFGNMIGYVRAFAECIDTPRQSRAVLRDIYRTGYGSVNGCSIRVSPVQ
ncbi:hypothetical protein [Streptomyces sp. NPDC005955]|uniref:hypothetical protein n=1 Tax=Streptomyces sp. NPDC005955 TaxID=3364738 RepID=UPI0036751770